MPLELVDEPDVIVNSLLAERKRLINGFYGSQKSDKKKLDESLYPTHYAISLSGEPTMYPKLPKLVKYLKSLPATKSIFLVTNGQEPDMLQRLTDEDALPTQIYLSTNASNKRTFHLVNRPRYKDAWDRWWRSLRFLARVNTRTVIRMTIIRDYNDAFEFLEEFAKIMLEGNPHFIELKSYMHVGMSTQRLIAENMLEMKEIRDMAAGLCAKIPYFSVMDESEISRIVVLQNQNRFVNRWIDHPTQIQEQR
jgi:tRNA wybutosine-synthesizing protein 1